jgi:homogentisate 1,2-dioxygenase
MTIMVETSRTFLFTEYARKICGALSTQGTDPKVWDKLPDHFSAHPETKKLLARLKEEKKQEKERVDYYHNVDLLKGRKDFA